EDESLMAKLDEDFSTLAQTEALQALSHPSKINALKALLNKDIKKESLKEGSSGLSDNKLIDKVCKRHQLCIINIYCFHQGHPDAYDKLVKELGSDRRAHASDRTKTPEEIAQEEKERLEELEKQRRERMLAIDDSTDEGSDDDNVEIQNSASIEIRPTSGDDLGDSFSIADDVVGKKGWIDGIYEQTDPDNQDESGSSSQDSEGDEDNEGDGDRSDGSGDVHVNTSTMKDWEQSDDDDGGLNMDGEETENLDEKEVAIGDKLSLDLHEVKTSSSHEMNAAGNLAPAKEKELPYVIEAPKNLTGLCSLLDSRSDDEVVEIINRIRAYNSIRLAAENRKKMQVPIVVCLLSQLNHLMEIRVPKPWLHITDQACGRAEMKKLKKLLKSEKKGAIRELRKDSQFVSGLKETARLMQEEERAEKYGKAMAFLQEQEYAFKSGQLGKGRKRRR
ncbi:hypothetical protein BHE74_00035261, partial [Ensete ventricosum]